MEKASVDEIVGAILGYKQPEAPAGSTRKSDAAASMGQFFAEGNMGSLEEEMTGQRMQNQDKDIDISNAARTSALYGREISGYLYSPYFFRSLLPGQFENKLRILKDLDPQVLGADAVDFVAGKLCVENLRSSKRGSIEESMQQTAEMYAREFEYSWGYFVPELLQDDWLRFSRRAISRYKVFQPYVMRSMCQHYQLSLEEIEKLCVQYLDGKKSPESFVSALKIHVPGSEVPQLMKEAAHRYVQGILNAVHNSVEIESRIKSGDIVLFSDGTHMYCAYRPKSHEVYRKWMARNIMREVWVLSRLEKSGGSIFNERRQLMPLDLVNGIFMQNWQSYREAAPSSMEAARRAHSGVKGAGHGLSDDPELEKRFATLYAKAGLLYYERDRIAFLRPLCGRVTGAPKESIDESARRIMEMDRTALNKAILEKTEETERMRVHSSSERLTAF